MKTVETEIARLWQENISQNNLLQKLYEWQEKIFEKLEAIADKASNHEEKDQERHKDIKELIEKMDEKYDKKFVTVRELTAVKRAFGVARTVITFVSGFVILKK